MPTLPLALKLKRTVHREVALAQDLMVLGTYDVFPGAVIHGGTAIWRCFSGNRFSEDVDFYLPDSARTHLASLSANLARKGLSPHKLKETSNSVFAKFGQRGLSVRFEASFRIVSEAVVMPFEMVDGSFMTVRTLRPAEMLREKVTAYEGRRKARDLYDIFFLLRLVEPESTAREAVISLLRNFEKPLDASELKAVIISGSAPRTSDMLEAIQRWAR